MQTWPIQDVHDKLAEVVDEATEHGPQVITRNGAEVAVVLSVEEFRRLTGTRSRLSEFFRNSPLAGSDIDLRRDQSPLPDAPKL